MAHADYGCCAVCDGQIRIKKGLTRKSWLCTRCFLKLTKWGVTTSDVCELENWLRRTSPAVAREALLEAGYFPCRYPNDLDHSIRSAVFPDIPEEKFWDRGFWMELYVLSTNTQPTGGHYGPIR